LGRGGEKKKGINQNGNPKGIRVKTTMDTREYCSREIISSNYALCDYYKKERGGLTQGGKRKEEGRGERI